MATNSVFLPLAFILLLSSMSSGSELGVISFARNHLRAFGYLSADYSSAGDTYDEALASALRKYQTFFRLNITGRIDPNTLESMNQPRCGVSDFPSTDQPHNISPQYTFMPGNPAPRWPPSRRSLSYGFSTPVIMPMDKIRSALGSAFSKWAEVSKFSFQELQYEPRADIHIGFYDGDHGDGHPFDGPGGILAHAFAPTAGLYHLDMTEQWSVSPNSSQFDLESISLHEIGHLLGLGHSSDFNAAMFPSFSPGEIKRILQPDDIDGLRALYPDG